MIRISMTKLLSHLTILHIFSKLILDNYNEFDLDSARFGTSKLADQYVILQMRLAIVVENIRAPQ